VSVAGSRGERVSVAEATTEDGTTFAEFFRTAWRQAGPDAPGFTGATDEVIAELSATEAFRDRVGGPQRRMYLAWEADRVVGFASTRRHTEDSVELSGIIVLQSHEGLGIGTALVEAAIGAARHEGYSTMFVRTETTNHRARTFYERRGFHVLCAETELVDESPVEVTRLSRTI